MIGVPAFVGLSVYAVMLGVAAPALLRRARWVVRAPRLAILLWQMLSAAWLISLALLGLTLAHPLLEQLAWPQYAPPGIHWSILVRGAAGLAFAGAIIARAGYVIARELAWAHRERRAHARGLALIGSSAASLGATIVEHQTPAVYCLPAPHADATVVVSRGALRLLSEEQLAAVVAHERGHLRLHHHQLSAIAGALSLAFPRVPLLRDADREIQALAEMAADDQARRHHSVDALAAALLAVATARAPEHALGAAGHGVTSRLKRMLEPTRPLPALTRLGTATGAVAAVILPVGLCCTTVFTAVVVLAG